MTVDIPIKPHLKKFVLFQLDRPEPLVVSENDMVGSAIMKILLEKRQHKFETTVERYTSRIKVILNHDMRERSPKLYRLIYANSELDREFKEALILWIRAQKQLGHTAKDACISFLATMKISEKEYSYDAAYKFWQRFNVKNKNAALKVS